MCDPNLCISYYLYMCIWLLDAHVGYDTFAMVVSFINISWQSTHVTIGIFEVHDITSVVMGIQVKSLLDTFGLLDKVIAYVKNEIFNFSILIFAWIYVVFCFAFDYHIHLCNLFGHAMSKVAQYVIDDTNIYVEFSKVSLKEAQSLLQKKHYMAQWK